jgi:hypothetical protein
MRVRGADALFVVPKKKRLSSRYFCMTNTVRYDAIRIVSLLHDYLGIFI